MEEFFTFLLQVKEKGYIEEKKKFGQNVSKFMSAVNENGISSDGIQLVINVMKDVYLDAETFKNLVLCLIPNQVAKLTLPGLTKEIFVWIFSVYSHMMEEKVDSVLYWIASLMDYNIINKEVLDCHYELMFSMLQHHPRPVCHLLYHLTKPDDVQLWRVRKVEQVLKLNLNASHIIALLQLFKKYKPEFVTNNVPDQKIETAFACSDKFYSRLRSGLKNVSRDSDISNGTIVVRRTNHKKRLKLLLPAIEYNTEEFKSFGSKFFLLNMKSGFEIGSYFHQIKQPAQSLSLLHSQAGWSVLVFGDSDLQRRFCIRLFALLEQAFIMKDKNTSDAEKEDLLNKVITLEQFSLQGLNSVSKFLALYLQSWDGYEFKQLIYKLIEWFTFKSSVDLNKNLLYPLYMLFVSASPVYMCEIISHLTSFVSNLYIRLEKERMNTPALFEEETVSSTELIPILDSLSQYVTELINFGLHTYPHNCSLLTTAIIFYEKISFLEEKNDVQLWTIIPPIVVYHSLFSFNVKAMNQVCRLLRRYECIAEQSPFISSDRIMQSKTTNLASYFQDIYNCLWGLRAFEERGYVFEGLSDEDSSVWSSLVNLNTTFDITRHMMFAAYRSEIALAKHKSHRFRNKEDLLEMLKSIAPDIVAMIEQINDTTDISDEYFG